MSQRTVSTVASIMLSASVFAVQGCVRPDPVVELPAPSAGGPCAESVAAALTRLADGQTLQCRNDSGEYRWESFTDPYPNSDRWVSAGYGLTLSGQGRRNPEMLSGKWIGYPLDPAARCRAEQAVVVRAGEVGEPRATVGELGEPLEFEVLPLMFTITLGGDCLWQKS